MSFPVADPGFPRGGGANSQGGANLQFCQFCQKLHENEEILAARGGPSPAPPLRSATASSWVSNPEWISRLLEFCDSGNKPSWLMIKQNFHDYSTFLERNIALKFLNEIIYLFFLSIIKLHKLVFNSQ